MFWQANLASILVADKAVGTINSIEDAINKRLNICVHPVMGPELKETFPNANFVDTETTKTVMMSGRLLIVPLFRFKALFLLDHPMDFLMYILLEFCVRFLPNIPVLILIYHFSQPMTFF
jgi:hypothetical protein